MVKKYLKNRNNNYNKFLRRNVKIIYNMSKSVFIGKSTLKKFKENGGQNPIEAAKLKL